jgi:hypothetical protein
MTLRGEQALMKSVVGIVLRNKPKEQKLERRSSKRKSACPATMGRSVARASSQNNGFQGIPGPRPVEF